jgi:predicted anti-sigma-YlaC factor YlaD
MSCREMAGYLSDYLDGELRESLRRVIEAHGGECPPCRAFVRTLARAVEALRAQPRASLPAALRRRLAGALKACPTP